MVLNEGFPEPTEKQKKIWAERSRAGSNFPTEEDREREKIRSQEVRGIYKKNKEQQVLNQEALVFLYKTDRSISDFDGDDVSIVKKIKEQRDPVEDACIIFECSSEEIATNTEEIDENTKVYMGEWNVDVLNIIKEYPNIEHLHESRLGKEIFMQTLETDPGIDSPEAALQALKDKNISVHYRAEEIMKRTRFSKKQQTYNLAKFTLKQLGLQDYTDTQEVYQKIEDLGLELCPAELGPQLRLQDISKENMNIAMEPINDDRNILGAFNLRNGNLFVEDVHPEGSQLANQSFVVRY
jgi:hypothetical protein